MTQSTEIDLEIAARLRPARPGSVPFDGTDRTGMPPREQLGAVERRAVLGVIPRRSMWPELEAIDARVSQLQQRQGEAIEQVRALSERRANAPTVDADALAAWELNGRKGGRPEATTEALDAEIVGAERERDGLERAVDLALEEKAAFVEKNRARLVNVAEQQTEAAHARMRALIDELEATRSGLIEFRQAAVWAALYPGDTANASPLVGQVALGLAKPITETLGLRPAPQMFAAQVLELLRRDADTLKTAATREQGAVLHGRDLNRPDDALWESSDEGQDARQRAMREAEEREARELARASRSYRQKLGLKP
jgi:hypothetical protein